MNVDLHCHSYFSDGLYSPKQLMDMAAKKSCVLFSITDHDTIEGNIIATKIAENYPFTFVTGIELSILIENKKFEVLGYAYNINSAKLHKKLEEIQQGRKDRLKKIIEKLQDLGFSVSYDEIIKSAKDAKSIGRPHVARIMVKKGYVRTIQEAFEQYLGEGKPAYVRKRAPSLKEAIDIIMEANGIPIVPHPLIFESNSLEVLEEILDLYVNTGVQGIEVYYDYKNNMPSLSDKKIRKATNFLEKYCRKNGLLMTIGSDYHGDKGALAEINAPIEAIRDLVEFFKK